MDYVFDTPITPLRGPPPVAHNYEPLDNSDERVADMRTEWETKYASTDLPPPPPGVYGTREEMINAAKSFAGRHGYTLVIGHSSKTNGEHSRCWLSCEYGGVYRNRHHLTPDARKRRRESRKTGCPMRVLGTKRRIQDDWMLRLVEPERSTHNHNPMPPVEPIPVPVSQWPELEDALYQWHQQSEADGRNIHGNTLKAKALELWKTLPHYRQDNGPLPDFGSEWLAAYRQRHDFPARVNHARGTESGPEVVPLIDEAPPPVAIESLLPIPADGMELFISVKTFVKEYMSQYDASHNFDHILRVLFLSNKILDAERKSITTVEYDTMTVLLAALLHDVGDRKYVDPEQDSQNLIADTLLERGASNVLALRVQMIANYVSYSTEIKNPRLVNAVISQHPELAIVQDADRLDAIGAIGIGRSFTFSGAKRPLETMNGVIEHFDEKLFHLESMMKTEPGRRLARDRTQRLQLFKSWWDEEATLYPSDIV